MDNGATKSSFQSKVFAVTGTTEAYTGKGFKTGKAGSVVTPLNTQIDGLLRG